jgi:hypothetical protein
MKPSVGRIVHYQAGDSVCRAAIVTSVDESGTADLFVMSGAPIHGTTHRQAVREDEAHAPDSWHWPERVDA